MSSDLKVFHCNCGAPCKITAHRDNLYILHCPRCGTEYAFLDSHPYFNHDEARTEIGDYVIFEAFKTRG